MIAGALNASTISEILAWHQTKQAKGAKGSPLKLGVLSGCHDDMSCGDSLQTYSSHVRASRCPPSLDDS